MVQKRERSGPIQKLMNETLAILKKERLWTYEIGRRLGISSQRAQYIVNILHEEGLIVKAEIISNTGAKKATIIKWKARQN